jgi:hypothetical protein
MVNGQHFSGTGYQLDGTENRDPILGIIVINPNLESIAESKITSQNYDAEFGQATAGVVSVQTKSGTNEFHGSLFEYRLTDKFQARNPYSQPDTPNPVTGRVLPETKRDQFGGSLGGPLLKNKVFFFGDYQGLRSTVGGSRLLAVPTALARTGNFSEYDTTIYDPLTRQPFPGNVIPQNRLSPQALAILQNIPLPNQTGSANSTRDNFVAQGSETFNSDAFNTRFDGRLNERINLFARYSYAKFDLNGPQALGAGGGPELVSLGGVSQVRNHSVALGFDYTISPTSILDFRFGFFKYGVDVLPNDFGTSPAADAGIPGLNTGDDFTSGSPGYWIQGNQQEMQWGTALNISRCNCPLAEHEKQWQVVTNLTKVMGNHSAKFGVDLRRAYNLRVPSDSHRAGEPFFESGRTASPTLGGGLGLATFMLGDVTFFQRYVSPTTDARETQWRFFVYAQDTWRPSSKLTINYGLRIEDIAPQAVNGTGNGGFFDFDTGQMLVAGVGDVNLKGNVENTFFNLAPRLGISYQINPKTVIRMGYGRSYDIGVFGSTFGHSVTQNLPVLASQNINRASDFDRVFTLAEGPPPPTFPQPDASGRFKAPDGVAPFVHPEKMRLPYVDSWNITVQRQLTNTLSAEVGYVGNKGTHVFFGDGPNFNANDPTIDGFAQGVPTNLRRPYYQGPVGGFGGAFGLTSGINYFCNCADNHYHSLQAKLTKQFSGGVSLFATYTLQKVRNYSGDQAFFDRSIGYGRPDWARTHLATFAATAELPYGKGKRWGSDASGFADAILGGWQLNAAVIIMSGKPFEVTYRNAFLNRDVGPERPNLVGDAKAGSGDGKTSPYFDVTPAGTPGSPWGIPQKGVFGDFDRNGLAGPGFWNVDASLFKRFQLGGARALELRVEALNVFNHVNRGNPDGQVGVEGNLNPNAGMITGTADNWQARNLQFAVRFQF